MKKPAPKEPAFLCLRPATSLVGEAGLNQSRHDVARRNKTQTRLGTMAQGKGKNELISRRDTREMITSPAQV
jgi:hypothetical protein